MDCDKCVKNLAVFAGGVLFGSAGLKLLSSRDAKKAYTHATAAALRMKESVMETVTTVQENAADILASAKDLNAQRTEQEKRGWRRLSPLPCPPAFPHRSDSAPGCC